MEEQFNNQRRQAILKVALYSLIPILISLSSSWITYSVTQTNNNIQYLEVKEKNNHLRQDSIQKTVQIDSVSQSLEERESFHKITIHFLDAVSSLLEEIAMVKDTTEFEIFKEKFVQMKEEYKGKPFGEAINAERNKISLAETTIFAKVAKLSRLATSQQVEDLQVSQMNEVMEDLQASLDAKNNRIFTLQKDNLKLEQTLKKCGDVGKPCATHKAIIAKLEKSINNCQVGQVYELKEIATELKLISNTKWIKLESNKKKITVLLKKVNQKIESLTSQNQFSKRVNYSKL